ncbi:tetratricopeptide repeat [Bacteroides sp. CAG:545]|nr:tetratricopeptide repeat [Bacteroides sp. CAG:545]
MRWFRNIVAVMTMLCALSLTVSAQVDRHDVRAGNRKFRKGDWKAADISYRKALVKDSTSVTANFNLANTLYRTENYDEAAKTMEKIKDSAPSSANAADYFYNVGDIAIAKKDWQGAVTAFKESLLRNPGDLEAKENYIYAKKMLENQQNGGGGNGQDNQDNQQNKDDQNGQGDQNQDQNKDKNQDQNQNDQNNQPQQSNQNNQNNQSGQQDGQQMKISPQQAQQMLRAIQAKEKETQDKVNKEKAEALKSRQKEKNW